MRDGLEMQLSAQRPREGNRVWQVWGADLHIAGLLCHPFVHVPLRICS